MKKRQNNPKQSPPAQAVHLAEKALRHDLESSESFVTLFHARLDLASRRLTYVDCGHGCEFLRHAGGKVETLRHRGLPLGIPSSGRYREGAFVFHPGDTLVLYSDGVFEAHPELVLTPRRLSEATEGATTAREMVERLLTLAWAEGPPSDDVTVLVLRCLKPMEQKRTETLATRGSGSPP